jgi:hypothetical protein
MPRQLIRAVIQFLIGQTHGTAFHRDPFRIQVDLLLK